MCTFRADFALKAFLQVLHLNDFLRVLFSAAMSDILKARKRKVLVEFLPATLFVWVLWTGWLFGLSYKMPNFSKLESVNYISIWLGELKIIIISNSFNQIFLFHYIILFQFILVNFKYNFLSLILIKFDVLFSGVAIVSFHLMSLKFKLQIIDPTEILLSRCIRAAEN